MTAHGSSQSTRARSVVLWIGFVVGAALRLLMVRSMGTFDMNDWIRWGHDVLAHGLAAGYAGSNLPFQYQIFAFCAWIAQTLHWTPVESLKTVALVFDSGTFVLILLLLKRSNANPLYALLYWLHPWFLLIFSLGYVDAEFSFFILLSVWLLALPAAGSRTVWAGVAIAAAVLMKPQALGPSAGLALYLCVRDRRTLNPLLFLTPIAVCVGLYEWYFFTRHNPPALDALLYLPHAYTGVTKNMPVLTAHMLNAWYPLAVVLKKPEAAIWSVSSHIQLAPHVRLDTLAMAAVALMIATYAIMLTREESQPTTPMRLVTFASLVVPFFATGAHENHLFLATALLVVVMALPRAMVGRLAFHGILAIEAVNLELLYGNDRLAVWARPAYSYEWRAVLSVASVVLCLMIIKDLSGVADAGGIRVRGEAAV